MTDRADELPCNELVEIVTQYVEGRMSRDDVVRFEAHLRECPGCATYVDQIRATIRVVGRAASSLSPEAERALSLAFRAWKRSRGETDGEL